jgi:hypothetical protein
MAKLREERILILAKTYPSPSVKHVETSCVAGINEHGHMRRLYPVPFRLIEEERRFKKWQWITVRIEKAAQDHRPESHKLYVDTLSCGNVMDSRRDWALRRQWLDQVPFFTDFGALQSAYNERMLSLGLVRPRAVIGLEIRKARNPDWTAEERDKLMRYELQGQLFSKTEMQKQAAKLRKVPFDFYYRSVCETPEGEKEYLHKIVDWEAGALFWNCKRSYHDDWEKPFREKLEVQMRNREMMFLMGNQHRFQDQWLIVSLIYPPMRTPHAGGQHSLF